MGEAFWKKKSLMCHLAWFSDSQTALPHLHSAHYLCVSICMNLLEGFARLIFQVNDRALGERLMSGMQSFSKLLKSFTIQLISLFSTLQKCKGWMQEAVIMQISQVCLWELEESAVKLMERWLSALRRIYKSSPPPCVILACQLRWYLSTISHSTGNSHLIRTLRGSWDDISIKAMACFNLLRCSLLSSNVSSFIFIWLGTILFLQCMRQILLSSKTIVCGRLGWYSK